jgi:hypothetical protein
MNKKVTNLTEKRENNRDKNEWTIEEIKKKTAEDLKKYRKISREIKNLKIFITDT